MTDEKISRQLVICCDGTNNNLTGRDHDTNVVKLCQLLANNQDDERLLFYDPGVGNPGELPGATVWDSLKRKAERVAGLALGRGVYENVAACYLFLMRNYRQGDQIFIFGFSRGAFTARSIGGLINQFGVLRPHMDSMVTTLLHTYFAERGESDNDRKAIAQQTTELFAAGYSQYVEIHFVGVWDTVASVGMWPFAAKFTVKPTIQNKRFRNVRQALALDEHRAQFQPRLYVDNNGSCTTEKGATATITQLWFRGSHCDVGGGYAKDRTAISDAALAWLVSEATQCGLRLRANGALLDNEALVTNAIQTNYTLSTDLTVHSELYNTCLWALTGMAIRDTEHITLDDGEECKVTAFEHPSVGEMAATYPATTSWRAARSKRTMLGCVALIPLLLLIIGQLLTRQIFVDELWRDAALILSEAPEYLRQNFAFARWQLLWWLDFDPAIGLARFWAPRWAVVWDCVLIGVYAYVLSWFAVSRFEWRAGLRRVGDAVPRLLSRLGWALPVAVFSDIGENIATWLTVSFCEYELLALALLSAFAMSILAALKVGGFVAAIALCVLPRSLLGTRGGDR